MVVGVATMPSRTSGATSAKNSGKRCRWSITMKPSSRNRRDTASERLRGPAGGTGALYAETTLHRIPAVVSHRPDRRFELRAADVVEVHVDAFGRGFAQTVAHRPLVIVECGVDAQAIAKERDLRGGARGSDNP